MELVRAFNKDCYDAHKKLIIYGASVYGELAYHSLQYISIKPDYYCDRARGGVFLDIPVIAPDELDEHINDIILIASADYFYEIKAFLDDLGCDNYFNICELLNMPIDREKISKRACEMLDNKELYFDAVNNVPDENQITVVHMGLTVTECCSLKCRDCSFLMQYYQHPQNIDLERYKYAVDRFLDIVDRVSEIRPIGGEPFVNPDMYKVLEWYHDNRKIGSLDVYTNGTIIPDDRTIEALKYKKVRVHISDYGAVNRERLDKVVERLTKEGIKFNIREYDVWQNGGDLRKRNFSSEQKEAVFSKCFMTNCYSFLKARFYGCPRAAHGMNMGAIPDMSYDYVDFGDANVPDDVLRQQLISLMRERKFLGTCDYCDGLDNHVEGIVPAIQVERALTIG